MIRYFFFGLAALLLLTGGVFAYDWANELFVETTIEEESELDVVLVEDKLEYGGGTAEEEINASIVDDGKGLELKIDNLVPKSDDKDSLWVYVEVKNKGDVPAITDSVEIDAGDNKLTDYLRFNVYRENDLSLKEFEDFLDTSMPDGIPLELSESFFMEVDVWLDDSAPEEYRDQEITFDMNFEAVAAD